MPYLPLSLLLQVPNLQPFLRRQEFVVQYFLQRGELLLLHFGQLVLLVLLRFLSS